MRRGDQTAKQTTTNDEDDDDDDWSEHSTVQPVSECLWERYPRAHHHHRHHQHDHEHQHSTTKSSIDSSTEQHSQCHQSCTAAVVVDVTEEAVPLTVLKVSKEMLITCVLSSSGSSSTPDTHTAADGSV